MSLYQLAGTSESFSLNSIASSRTNHKLTNVHLGLNFVTSILLMYINPSDATVYTEFNWWVDHLFVGLPLHCGNNIVITTPSLLSTILDLSVWNSPEVIYIGRPRFARPKRSSRDPHAITRDRFITLARRGGPSGSLSWESKIFGSSFRLRNARNTSAFTG